MRITQLHVTRSITLVGACFLTAAGALDAQTGHQTVQPLRAPLRVTVPPEVEAAIRIMPRPVLLAQVRHGLPEDAGGTFTPARVTGATPQALDKGQIVGVANLSASNKLGLPAGQYDYVIMK